MNICSSGTRTLPCEENLNEVQLELGQDIPAQNESRLLRWLRYRVFITYRTLFSLIGILNIVALAAIFHKHATADWLETPVAVNLMIAVLVRQDAVVNALFAIACSVPRSAPLCIRSRCATIYHLGGVHSGAGVFATLWLAASTVYSTTICLKAGGNECSLASLAISWFLTMLLCTLVGFSYPAFRKRFHNQFELLHRFLGWASLSLFWVQVVLSVKGSNPAGHDLGLAFLRSPRLWMLGIATCSIASSWVFLRRVSVTSVRLSDHAIQLVFDYTVPTVGKSVRVSHRPLLEWHSFATIPHLPRTATNPGYSLVVSNAGDWTRECIRAPPTKLWIRGVPVCGVMRIAALFNRMVIIATGSGIGPLLGHIEQPSCPTRLLWSTPDPKMTFGEEIMDRIEKNSQDAVIHDTTKHGRPDLLRLGYNMAKGFQAEAVVIVSNERITKKLVYGLETRGFMAYGAIWDS